MTGRGNPPEREPAFHHQTNHIMIPRTEKLSHVNTAAHGPYRDINIEISQTGIIGLVGSNGAGKSTTMNIICGTLSQTEGRVFVNNIDLREKPEAAKKEIGFLPQTLPLYTDLTVDEYLTYCADLRLMPKTEIRHAVQEVKRTLRHCPFQLTPDPATCPADTGNGWALRRPSSTMPKLVVMDEPTTGLDPNQLIEARKLIRRSASSTPYFYRRTSCPRSTCFAGDHHDRIRESGFLRQHGGVQQLLAIAFHAAAAGQPSCPGRPAEDRGRHTGSNSWQTGGCASTSTEINRYPKGWLRPA